MPESTTYPFILPPLRFAYNALEPYMDAKTLEIHHSKHHAGYIKALNVLIADQPQLHDISIEELLRRLDTVPESMREKVAFYAGGHANHQFLWKILKPAQAFSEPKGIIKSAIVQAFGDVENFKRQFIQAVLSLFGSGWVFLVVDPKQGGLLAIHSAQNNESVLPLGTPGLLICDMWEHAYYLKHENRCIDYMEAFWNLVDWDVVSNRLSGIREGRKQL
jgi:Fe-Mn family superoxide dismutase